MDGIFMDNGSLTPPLSPMDSEDFLDGFPQEQSPSRETNDAENSCHAVSLPLFNCSRNNRAQEADMLNRLLEQCDNASFIRPAVYVEIFGYYFANTAMEEKLDQLMSLLRQWIGKFDVFTTDQIVAQGNHLREEIQQFLDVLKNRLCAKCSDNTESMTDVVPQSTIMQLHSTLLYMDKLSEIPYQNYSSINSNEYHKFHMTLDVYWKVLEFLYSMETAAKGPGERTDHIQLIHNVKDNAEDPRSFFSQTVQLILWELVTLSHGIFNQVLLRESLTTGPFSCPCVQDLWGRLVHLLNHCQEKCEGESFWLHIHSIMMILLDDASNDESMEHDSDVYEFPPPCFITKDNTAFCLWLLTHLSSITTDSTKVLHVALRNNYLDVTKILKKCLSKSEVPEVELRYYLQICLKLTATWGPDMNTMVLMWDYFYRKLNNSFQVNSSSIEGIANLSKTAGTLLETCSRLSSVNYVHSSNDTSFQMFVGLLCNNLKTSLNMGSIQEWKQMKGRVYSKFHQRRIQELREAGLHNFCVLFISLALTADLEDVGNKMCGFCEMVELRPQGVGRKLMAWRGMLAIAMEYVQRKMNITCVAEKLVSDFNSICLDISQESGHRFSLWQLVSLYLDSLQEIFERSLDLSSSPHILIGKGFQCLLPACKTNEIQSVLTVLQEVLAKIRSLTENSFTVQQDRLKEIYSSVYNTLYPSLRDLSCSLTATTELADCLVALTILAIQFDSDNVQTLMKFCLGDSINKGVLCRYLSQVMSLDGVMSHVSRIIPNHQVALVKAWISCSVFVPNGSAQLRCMLGLEDVRGIFLAANMDVPVESDKRAIYHFLKAIQAAHTKIQGWKERIELRDKVMQYFCDIPRLISPILQSLQPADTLSNVYAVVGYIVKCCAPLIFIESKPDCPLPSLINNMVLPHTLLSTDKPVSPVFLNVVKEHLHQFVIGLSKLDYRKAPYLQRRLGDIVSIYLPKFWMSTATNETGVASAVHPLVVSLRESFSREPTEASISFREFITEIVRDKFFLGAPLLLLSHHHMALMFLKELVKRSTKKEVVVRDSRVVLYGVMKVHVLTDIASVQNTCHFLIQHYTESVCQCGQKTDRDVITESLSKFVKDYKKTHLDSVIKAMERIPTSCADLVHGISKQIQHHIVEHESYRGVGADSKLRTSYIRLVRHFGLESGEKG